MKKNLFVLFLVAVLLILTTTAVSAGAKNNTVYTEWGYLGAKSGYFLKTGSGLVHLWSYDRPYHPVFPDDPPNIHFIFKPLDKFPDAECEPGSLRDQTWTPAPLYSATNAPYRDAFLTVFPDLGRLYHMCAYEIH